MSAPDEPKADVRAAERRYRHMRWVTIVLAFALGVVCLVCARQLTRP